MQNDFKDSVKARLWDFKYTPFLSSYVFAWLYWNSKLILIFTSPKLDVTKKIEMLSWNNINYEYPLYFALFYVFLFPLASAVFYAVTLGYKALMNKIQQLIQDKTPMPQERANKIIRENTQLELEQRDIVDKLERVKQDYKQKENSLEELYAEKEKDFQNRIDKKVEEEGKKLTDDLIEAYAHIDDKNAEIDSIKKEHIEKEKIFKNQISTLNNKVSKKEEEIKHLIKEQSDLKTQISKLNNNIIESKKVSPLIEKALQNIETTNDIGLKKLKTEHLQILVTFYNHDSSITLDNLKSYVKKDFNISKTITELRVNEIPELIESNGGFCYLTKTGRKMLELLFN